MKITNRNDHREVVTQLQSLLQVLEVLVLDAGKCYLLIISTGGYSFYTPKGNVQQVSLQEARIFAENNYHLANFNNLVKHHKGI